MKQTKRLHKLELNQETLKSLTDKELACNLNHTNPSCHAGCSIGSLCGLPCTPVVNAN
jgi:hypothetical protein